MKQPLTIIPPAQAEALYDAALEEQEHKHISIKSTLTDDWDDSDTTENASALEVSRFPRNLRISMPSPARRS